MALGPLAVADALEDALLDEPVEPVSEDVAGDAEAFLEFVEAAQSEEVVADDLERPALTHDLEGSGDRAVLAFVVTLQHAPSLAKSVASSNSICYSPP